MSNSTTDKRSTIGISICFLALASVLSSLAWRYGAWCYLLLYPAVSFAIVGVSYLGVGHRVYGKNTRGQRHWLATLLLGPYLLLANGLWHLVRLTSREAPFDVLHADLLLSRRLLSGELPTDVRSVVDLTCELSDPTSSWQLENYRCFPMLDALGADPEELVALAEEIIQMPSPVLIHCAQGHGRTGLVAAVVLMFSGYARTASQALDYVQFIRPGIKLSAAQRATLRAIDARYTKLRFDGIYSDFDGAMYRHLRFFENGKAIFILIALNAQEIAEGFNEAYHKQCGGMFQIDEGQISFVITDYGFDNREDVVVEYSGDVCINSLILDIYSRTTQHRSSRRFEFVPVTFLKREYEFRNEE